MKKIVSIILSALLVLTMPTLVSASDYAGNVINIDTVTVYFSANSVFSVEEQQLLAQSIVSNDNFDQTTTYGLLCTLFGHKTTTESITVIEHCVSNTQPRCLETLQEVTACSRCDYVYIQELSSMYIFCCD